MKKLSFVLFACTALVGCSSYEPDLDKAAEVRAENRTAFHQEFGCPFTDDHAAYRQCVLNTYYGTHPRTYSVKQDKDGKSIAVIRNESRSSYDAETDTYKTERVIVIETEEKLVPVPVEVTPQLIEPEVLPPDLSAVEEPAPKETWWDTYQKDKPAPAKEPQCPCPDPNEPCPQCVDK